MNLGLCLLITLVPLVGQAQVLDQLISQALVSHPSAQVQQALAQAAQTGVDSARWQFYPTPSVGIERSRASAADPSYQGDSHVSTLRLQQPLWTGGRLTAGLDKAQAGLAASQAALEEVRQQLALRVVQAYGDWLAAHLKNLANEKSLATHTRLRDQVRRRISEGLSAQSDLTLALARLETLAADMSVAHAQQDIALSRLGQLLGRYVSSAELGTTFAMPRRIDAGLQTLLDMARSVSPVVQKVQAQARVQEATLAERRSELSPEVYLRAERQYGNYSFANAAPETRLFIGLNSRFGAGLSNLSNVEGASLQLQAAQAEVAVQSRNVNEQILADHALAASAGERLTAINASLKAAQDVSESYDRQFLAGRKSWLDVMNAARELAQTEGMLADIESTQVVVTWRLAIFTQGLAAVLSTKA
jgi:adhesin transport system outer membrane protein